MPTTYNGIGTHYYGRRNARSRPGPCPHCGHGGELTSYDTRLWVVFLFIPVVPMGRKRILDYCPSCTRHFAVDADKWETARQLEVSGALEKYRANPTPEEAMAAHQLLLNYHEFEQAVEFRKTMDSAYADNARVQAYLGSALAHLGQPAAAEGYFARALSLRADLPEARIGVARGHIRSGRLDEARALLDFLEKPGAVQLYSLEPLETLARAYQGAGRHQEALDLCGKLIEALPRIVEHKGFRAMVTASEKALGRRESQLPKLRFRWRRLLRTEPSGGGQQAAWRGLLVVGVILALVALGFVIANEYIRRHRTLYIVNGYAQPVRVRIDGVGDLGEVRAPQRVVLVEGRYHAIISGPVQQDVDFEVRSRYFRRWFGEPLWVLNPGGAALLIRNTVVYASSPPPATVSFHTGRPFESFERVTHPFQELPRTLRMKKHETRTLIQLDQHRGAAPDILSYLVEHRRQGEALDLAETRLRVDPDDEQMLRLYAATAEGLHQTERLDAFLRQGLAERPVRVEWHRLYQGRHDRPAEHAALVAEYDALLQAEPGNSGLLYLRGRVDGDRAVSRAFFERALAEDPHNPYPVYALGFDRMVAGDWTGARPQMERAARLRPSDRNFTHWLLTARLALGEAPAVEQEARARLATNPVDYPATVQLIDALATQDHRDAALAVGAAFEKAFTAKHGKQAGTGGSVARHYALYAVGDFAGLEAALAADPDGTWRTTRCAVLIERGRIAEATPLLPAEADRSRDLFTLALALAAQVAGDTAAAATWREQTQRALASGSQDSVRAAELLTRAAPPTPAEAAELALLPPIKALILAELALRHPQAGAELAALARRLNVDRSFPYHLVRRATAEAR